MSRVKSLDDRDSKRQSCTKPFAPIPLHLATVTALSTTVTDATGRFVTTLNRMEAVPTSTFNLTDLLDLTTRSRSVPSLAASAARIGSAASHVDGSRSRTLAAMSANVSELVEAGSGRAYDPALDDGRSMYDPLAAATITTVNIINPTVHLASVLGTRPGVTEGSVFFGSSGTTTTTTATLLVDLLSTGVTGVGNVDPTARQLEMPKAMDEHFLIANWQDCVVVILFCLLIVVTVIGNTLVILSVITTRRLRTVTNCFVMSLAVADWLVGIFVMPPAVAVHLMGSWQLGWILCDIWISLDVLLCTASILSLCAISIDRYVLEVGRV
uniref:G-protein coupled receptors family 1 profile domain-containing protein n=1 Tax=Anopheles christyi TaxID=43041 RepID=A0A182JSL4_9DIPT